MLELLNGIMTTYQFNFIYDTLDSFGALFVLEIPAVRELVGIMIA